MRRNQRKTVVYGADTDIITIKFYRSHDDKEPFAELQTTDEKSSITLHFKHTNKCTYYVFIDLGKLKDYFLSDLDESFKIILKSVDAGADDKTIEKLLSELEVTESNKTIQDFAKDSIYDDIRKLLKKADLVQLIDGICCCISLSINDTLHLMWDKWLENVYCGCD